MNFDEMSLKELRELKSKLDRAINTHDDRRRLAAVAAAKEIAKAHGFNLADLAGTKVRKVAPQKYAHHENPSLTWSGRGRKPKWVAEVLDQGKQLDNLLIS